MLIRFAGSLVEFEPMTIVLFFPASAILVFLFLIVCTILFWIGTKDYEGKLVWKWCFRMVPVAIITAVLIKVLFSYLMSPDFGAEEYSGEEAKSYLKALIPDKEYPLVGVWKEDCEFEHGFAFDRAGNGGYSMVFFGPGGLSLPEGFPNKPSSHDGLVYSYVNDDRIDIQLDGVFHAFKRCAMVETEIDSGVAPDIVQDR